VLRNKFRGDFGFGSVLFHASPLARESAADNCVFQTVGSAFVAVLGT